MKIVLNSMSEMKIAGMHFQPCSNVLVSFNPFTLNVPLESVVCNFHTFENNLRIKQKFTKSLRESCCLTSGQHFSFRYFPKNAFDRKIFPKLSGLSECEWVKQKKMMPHACVWIDVLTFSCLEHTQGLTFNKIHSF